MKSLQLAVVLCLALAHCSLHSSLNSYVAKLRAADLDATVMTRSIQKREDPSPCFNITCLNPGQKCQTDPFDITPCTECTYSLAACIRAAPGNQTVACGCYDQVFSCLQSKGGFCPVYSSYLTPGCKSNGGANCACSAVIPPSIPISICKFNMECLGDTVCTRRPTLNEPCIPEESKCSDFLRTSTEGFACSNDTRKCVHATDSIKIGDPCNATSECVGATTVPQGSSCTGGICVGVPANGVCMDTDECAFGLYCKNSQCVPQIAAGGACSVVDKNPCAGAYVCGAEATCVALYSKPLGANCVYVNSSAGRGAAVECNLGTFCSPITNKCRGPWQFNRCNPALNSSDCEAGTECSCKRGAGFQCLPTTDVDSSTVAFVPATCKDHFLAAADCLGNAKCKGDIFTPNGCAQKSCMAQIHCLLSCYLPSLNQAPGFVGCVNFPTYTCVPSDSGSAASSVTFAAALLFAVLLVVV